MKKALVPGVNILKTIQMIMVRKMNIFSRNGSCLKLLFLLKMPISASCSATIRPAC